jgi:hypothetical protein
VERVGGLEPARIAVMTPYPDEDPLVVRTPAGWSLVSRTGEINDDLQPERIERP